MTAGSRLGVYVAGILFTLVMLTTVTAAGATSRRVVGSTGEDTVSSSRTRVPTLPTWPAEAATIPDPTGTGGHITPRLAVLYEALRAQGMIRSASCWDPHLWNPTSDHPKGRACDLFHNHREPVDVAFGWQVATWLAANQATYGIRYVIWQGQVWHARRVSWGPYRSKVYNCPDPANVTGCHYDHIHISVF